MSARKCTAVAVALTMLTIASPVLIRQAVLGENTFRKDGPV
jgi:hypothetical protein